MNGEVPKKGELDIVVGRKKLSQEAASDHFVAFLPIRVKHLQDCFRTVFWQADGHLCISVSFVYSYVDGCDHFAYRAASFNVSVSTCK